MNPSALSPSDVDFEIKSLAWAQSRLHTTCSAEKALYLSTNAFKIQQKCVVPEQRSVLA